MLYKQKNRLSRNILNNKDYMKPYNQDDNKQIWFSGKNSSTTMYLKKNYNRRKSTDDLNNNTDKF
jgi:hypothetical protein